jgi:hypothetical protein
VSQSDEEIEKQQAWRALSEARLIEIPLEEFVERIRDVKRIVMVRLHELLDLNTGTRERESAAYSLGTLKGLELKLMAKAEPPQSPKK